MSQTETRSYFDATVLRPAAPGSEAGWAFVVLPKEVSAKLPRRGRTTVSGSISGEPFKVTLEPDGQRIHWLRLEPRLLEVAGITFGDVAGFEIMPVAAEPEPEIPDDLLAALDASPEARAVWESTTTLARVDWIHWIESAKQAKTRTKRIADASAMLASGKRRVCCFDSSGFYSKALSAPKRAT